MWIICKGSIIFEEKSSRRQNIHPIFNSIIYIDKTYIADNLFSKLIISGYTIYYDLI